jgi:hypothetical protein
METMAIGFLLFFIHIIRLIHLIQLSQTPNLDSRLGCRRGNCPANLTSCCASFFRGLRLALVIRFIKCLRQAANDADIALD